jgi:BirA family biotin operon repressor/biotin-[acetyl-CoA-carboxylase] ligase
VAKKDLRQPRPALDPALILSELAKGSSNWRDITAVTEVTSTNDLVTARLLESPQTQVFAVTADEQVAGRGRLQREWTSPFGAGIALSIAIPTTLFSCPISAIPLVVGVVVNTCLLRYNVVAKLKWPNDLMIVTKSGELGKVGGILVQLQNEHVIVGIGINTDLDITELPTKLATSLALAGIQIQREVLIAQILCELEIATKSGMESWHEQYVSMSCTLGTQVNVTNLEQEILTGLAKSISTSGALILETEKGLAEVIAGDVTSLRSKEPQIVD